MPRGQSGGGAACLRLTTPGLRLQYPYDPSQHMAHILRVLEPHVANVTPPRWQGYFGPWIEDMWIADFRPLAAAAVRGEGALKDTFGPYIPLFIPWIGMWLPRRGYPVAFLEALSGVLRPGVLYITVAQNDEGLAIDTARWPHLLILSAGGHGHAAVPLLKQPEPLHASTPVALRRWLVSYVGDSTHAPDDLRRRMLRSVAATAAARRFSAFTEGGRRRDWRQVMASSRFSLCPRGFGRTSFHFAETILMGLLPIQARACVHWPPGAWLRIGACARTCLLPPCMRTVPSGPCHVYMRGA